MQHTDAVGAVHTVNTVNTAAPHPDFDYRVDLPPQFRVLNISPESWQLSVQRLADAEDILPDQQLNALH